MDLNNNWLNSEGTAMNMLPLIVDLDGTLILSDILHESALNILGKNPFTTLCIPYWLSQGKIVLKNNRLFSKICGLMGAPQAFQVGDRALSASSPVF